MYTIILMNYFGRVYKQAQQKGEYTMERLEFSARCNCIGYDAYVLAKQMSLSVDKTRPWFDMNWNAEVPATAVFTLTKAEQMHFQAVKSALALIRKKINGIAHGKTIKLPYWANQRKYDSLHDDAQNCDYRIANARLVALAQILSQEGFNVQWVQPQEQFAYVISGNTITSDVRF